MGEYSANAVSVVLTRCMSPEGRTWLQEAFERHVLDGISMDDALGFRTPGNAQNLPEQHALTMRNKFLRKALKEFQEAYKHKFKLKDFHDYALTFQHEEWPKMQDLDTPLKYTPQLHQYLFWVHWYARRAGKKPVPVSISGFSDAVR
jgi:hypothetical protein